MKLITDRSDGIMKQTSDLILLLKWLANIKEPWQYDDVYEHSILIFMLNTTPRVKILKRKL